MNKDFLRIPYIIRTSNQGVELTNQLYVFIGL